MRGKKQIQARLLVAVAFWGLLFAPAASADEPAFGLSLSLSQNVDLASSSSGSNGGGSQGPPLVVPGVMDFGPPDLPPPGETFGPEPPSGEGGLLNVTGPTPLGGGTATMLGARAGVQPTQSLGFSLGVNTTLSSQATPATRPQLQPQGSSAPQPDTTILLGEADVALAQGLALGVIVPIGLQNGLADPSAGLRLMAPLHRTRAGRFFLVASAQASAPFSSVSQQQGKITALQATVNPSFTHGAFLIGATAGVSYGFYSTSAASGPPGMGLRSSNRLLMPPPGPGGPGAGPGGGPPGQNYPTSGGSASSGGPPAPDLFTAAESASLGFRLSPAFLLSTSAGLSFTRRLDDSLHWSTQLTALNLNYSVGMLSLGAALSFVSDPQLDQQASPPSRPAMSFTLGYLFGNPGALLPPGMGPPAP